MDMTIKESRQVIQTHENNDTIHTKGDIHVTNYITESSGAHDIAWFKALTMQSEMSYILFDGGFNIIHWNNKYGTLDAAKSTDLKDLHSITNYYKNKIDCLTTLTNNIFHAHYSQQPTECSFKLIATGEIFNVNTIPVVVGEQTIGLIVQVEREETG